MNEEPDQGTPATGWDAPVRDPVPLSADDLVVDVEGYEGPLDLLLALARTHKIDLARISVTALADQYLAFIARAEMLKLDVAADYLVMAAWLAFLKSRLLLPKADAGGEAIGAEDMARRLAFRLMRLDAMRKAGTDIMRRKRLGIDVFPRGQPEGVRLIRATEYTAEIYDLLKAYAEQKQRNARLTHHVVRARKVWSIKEARQRLERLIGASLDGWHEIDRFILRFLPPAGEERTALAASFGATLELAREGEIEIRQERPFGPIHVRKKAPDGA